MADIQLPNTDPDLILAQELQQYIQSGNQPKTKDPLFDTLMNYKQERAYTAKPGSFESTEIWNAIESNIKANKKDVQTNIFSLNTTKLAWAAAACVLIIAFASISYFLSDSQPELLISTNQQIQTTTLADGSMVTMRPNSKLYQIEISDNKHTYRIEGEGFFEVQENSNRNFVVEAGSGIVTVLGTSFNLSSWGNQTQVFLEEGSIEFSNTKKTLSMILEPGQSASVDGQTEIKRVENVSADEFKDWMNKEMIFTNRTAAYVFRELEQQFNIEITAPDSILTVSLSGGISLENQNQSLIDLGKVLGGSFEEPQAGSFTFSSNN